MSKYKELGSYIDRTYKVVRQDLINRFKMEGVELTPEQWVILSKLGNQDMYQTDLANMSFRDKPTVSRIVDILVKKKLVQRIQDRADGRKYHIKITETGNEVIRRAGPAVEQSRAVGWTNLSDEEYDDLIRLLDKIFENYTKKNEDISPVANGNKS